MSPRSNQQRLISGGGESAHHLVIVVEFAWGAGIEPPGDVQHREVHLLVAGDRQSLPELIERGVVETFLPVRHWPAQRDVHLPRWRCSCRSFQSIRVGD